MEKIDLNDYSPVARTLFIPLVCRALDTARVDALIHDPLAVELCKNIENSSALLLGMSKMDQTFTAMRVRQFDNYARAFLSSNPQGLVVDIGCGLDTRPDRLKNNEMIWVGVDMPEVSELMRRFLPDKERHLTIACSILNLSWLDTVKKMKKPVIFIAEGVFPYFTKEEIKPLVSALADYFPGSELVFDALISFSVTLHNLIHPFLKRSGTSLKWGVDDPYELETWGTKLLHKWNYFEDNEPRLGLTKMMKFIPKLANANFILHYQLGKKP